MLALSSLATLWYLDMPLVLVAQQTLQGTNAFSLLAIPFFIMTGQLLGAGGLANRIVDFANLFVGRLPGGLSIVNSVACMFFGNLSGSAVADTSAIGSVMIPIMKEKGYSAEYAVGVTISSAIQGVVVPPSHNLVLYSIVAAGVVGGISVGKLFMAGIVPGFLLLGTLCVVGRRDQHAPQLPQGRPGATQPDPGHPLPRRPFADAGHPDPGLHHHRGWPPRPRRGPSPSSTASAWASSATGS